MKAVLAQLCRLLLEWCETPDERDIVTEIKQKWSQ